MRDNRVVFRGSDGEMHAGYAVEDNFIKSAVKPLALAMGI